MPPACCSASCTLWVMRFTSTMATEPAHPRAPRQPAARDRSGRPVRPGEQPRNVADEIHEAAEEEHGFLPECGGDVLQAIEDAGLRPRQRGRLRAAAHLEGEVSGNRIPL